MSFCWSFLFKLSICWTEGWISKTWTLQTTPPYFWPMAVSNCPTQMEASTFWRHYIPLLSRTRHETRTKLNTDPVWVFFFCNFSYTWLLSRLPRPTLWLYCDLEYGGCVFHCGLTSSGALVVEEDPVDSKHVVGLSKVDHDPVGVELGGTWSITWRQRGSDVNGWPAIQWIHQSINVLYLTRQKTHWDALLAVDTIATTSNKMSGTMMYSVFFK